jgi:predicted ribosomally synthesized peptide with SipW-like signal peptide
MKKIIGLTVAALMVMGLVGGGTWAYFSDPEVSQGNVLAAGTLDLHIGGGDSNVQILSVSNAYPGVTDNGSTVLNNNGNLAGYLDISFDVVSDMGGSGGTEYENNPGEGNGDLDAEATIAIWLDINESDDFDDGDILLGYPSDNTTTRDSGSPATPTKIAITSYDGVSWNDVMTLDEKDGTNDEATLVIDYLVPTTATNAIQGDSVTANMTFTLEQH